ncbi:MAG TPA: S-adenosylmethionine:tRNA ribosyltransferase-isomerase, partial [Kofleriaceae bacterium]
MFAPSDYTYELPSELIAQEPAGVRDASRLLHVPTDGPPVDHMFADLPELLPADAVLIANDTRVIPARILGHKDTGGAVELFFLEPEPSVPAPADRSAWRCLAKARRALRPGQLIRIEGCDIAIEILTDRAADGSLVVAAPADAIAFLDAHGHIPLPHYIARDDRSEDRDRYQTMFAKVPGAVA